MAGRRPGSRQPELFARSKRSVIEIAPTHRLVMITEETDWTDLEELSRSSCRKSGAESSRTKLVDLRICAR